MAADSESLDIALPESTVLLQQILVLLRESGIPHSQLAVMEDVSQNLGVADREKVFVKVYRRKDGLSEVSYTKIAADHGAATLPLLASSDWCSVWGWRDLAPLPLERLPEILKTIRSVHSATAGKNLAPELSYEAAANVVLGRLTSVSHGAKSLVADLVQHTAATLSVLAAGRPQVFIHGDLQLKNMGLTVDGPVIFDWEICCSAPVELELAKLVENLYTTDRWEPDFLASHYGADLDGELLLYSTVLRYLQNIAFHLERQEITIAETQLAALQKLKRFGL